MLYEVITFGLVAIASALVFMALLFMSIIGKGYSAFVQTEIRLPVAYAVSVIDPDGTRNLDDMRRANYGKLYRDGIQSLFPDVTSRQDRRTLNGLVSSGASFQIRDAVFEDQSLIGKSGEIWVPASDDVDMLVKGKIVV